MDNTCKYGINRVLSPKGVLPQAADQLDNRMIPDENEILLDVSTLNIDSASFTQIQTSCNNDLTRMSEMIMQIVRERGKMQNPVTGSGGMLLGKIKQIGKNLKLDAKIGDEVASLVSLSLTPLKIHKILEIHPNKDQVDIVGEAILFESSTFAKIPSDLPRHIVLSALDVAGAPAQVAKLVKPGDSVLILGASGKSGLLCSYQARRSAGDSGNIIGIINDQTQFEDLQRLNACNHIIVADATKPMDVYEKVLKANNGRKVDVTINVVNVQNTEMTSILPTRNGGIVYFFSMATSFTKAALGAEGIASEAIMVIGNGYTAGHAEHTLNMIRESRTLFDIFQKRYGKEE